MAATNLGDVSSVPVELVRGSVMAASQAGTAGVLTGQLKHASAGSSESTSGSSTGNETTTSLESTPLVFTNLSQKTPISLNSSPTISTESSQIAPGNCNIPSRTRNYTVHISSTSQSGTDLNLLEYSPSTLQTFTWGIHDAEAFSKMLDTIYSEVVHWKGNTFTIPYGEAGSKFASELARLFNAFAQASTLEAVALKAVAVMQILLLQKPSKSSKAKDHLKCLNKRLHLWNDGDLEELLLEGRAIQSHLGNSKTKAPHQEERLATSFAALMSQGRTKTALHLLEKKATGAPLQLDDVVDVSSTRCQSTSCLSGHFQ